MNLAGMNCYLQESSYIKTRKDFSGKFNHLYLPVEYKLKDLYNSNDFSLLSVIFQSLFEFYDLKDNSLIEKKLFLISKEGCIFLEDNFLRKTYSKKSKNFSYWHSNEWIFEKECYKNFYFGSTFIFIFLSINPSNYYIDSFFSSWLQKEKTKTWVTLLIFDIFYSVDNFKELGWNLKSNSFINLKTNNLDTLFNFSSIIKLFFHQAGWKYLNNILLNVAISKGNLFSCVLILIRFKNFNFQT